MTLTVLRIWSMAHVSIFSMREVYYCMVYNNILHAQVVTFHARTSEVRVKKGSLAQSAFIHVLANVFTRCCNIQNAPKLNIKWFSGSDHHNEKSQAAPLPSWSKITKDNVSELNELSVLLLFLTVSCTL